MKELYELKEMLCDELKEYGKKGELKNAGTLDVVDKLAHTVKNLDKIIESYEEGESGMYPYAYNDGMDNRSYRRSYRGDGRSYAQRRDSMGRYSGRGYSRHGLTDKLRDLMEEAPDENTRMEIQRLVDKME